MQTVDSGSTTIEKRALGIASSLLFLSSLFSFLALVPGTPAIAADNMVHLAHYSFPRDRIGGGAGGTLEAWASHDPLGFLEYCREHYQSTVQDYACTFVKRECLRGKVRDQQTAVVRFREEPFSVDMTFVENIGECKRALYVEDMWVDDDGNELAWAEPGGAIVRVFISKIQQPIHGPRAKKASRRTIDQFGFGRTLDLVLQYSRKAQQEGVLCLKYVGTGQVDGRPTYVLERMLPYNGSEEPYPDRVLVLHIDQEHLLPTACYSYADEKREVLLGSYVFRDVHLNNGYEDKDFDPEYIGF